MFSSVVLLKHNKPIFLQVFQGLYPHVHKNNKRPLQLPHSLIHRNTSAASLHCAHKTYSLSIQLIRGPWISSYVVLTSSAISNLKKASLSKKHRPLSVVITIFGPW